MHEISCFIVVVDNRRNYALPSLPAAASHFENPKNAVDQILSFPFRVWDAAVGGSQDF